MPTAADPSAPPDAEVHRRVEQGRSLPMLVWRLDPPRPVLSSAPVGGGLGLRGWILNAQVVPGYDRVDLAAHAHQLAERADLAADDPGVTLFTAAVVDDWRTSTDGGVRADVTVGVREPVWAAASAPTTTATGAGTINIVAFLPVRLSPAALVNAVATATEAKTQALLACGVDGSGTATDAVCVVGAPAATAGEDAEEVPFGGPRSEWGSRLARAVHAAVVAGTRASLARLADGTSG